MSNALWADVPGFDGLYQVSSDGRVRSLRGERRELSLRLSNKGYPIVTVSVRGVRTTARVHRWVLLAFVGECPVGMEACHRNGRRGDASLSNLRWGTPTSNQADKIAHGTLNSGERNGQAKLTGAQAREIRASARPGTELAHAYAISTAQVSRIRRGARWGQQ